MAVSSYEELLEHVGHNIAVHSYGEGRTHSYGRDDPVNVAIECVDCSEVLLDFDQPQDPLRCVTCDDSASACDCRPEHRRWEYV